MPTPVKAERQVSIDYLRAFVTILVLAHHCSLAYTTFARYDPTNFLASTAPIVDKMRWGFLDYAENFNDVFFMSLMFFISGLFVWSTLRARGIGTFLRDRLLRLGLPFIVGAALVMPVAYYPSWLATGHPAGYLAFWLGFLKNGWSAGPLWFVWVLLLFDLIASGVFFLFRRRKGGFVARTGWKPFLILFVVCFFAYVPLLARFGFGTWIPFFTPPFWFQLPRFLLYLTWFFAGALIGSNGIRKGFMAEGSPFARNWPLWVAGCVVAYNLLWFVPQAIQNAKGPTGLRDLTYVIFWVLSCCASCFGFLALFRGVFTVRRKWMDSIARTAYIMYIVHYVYVTWSQYFLLDVTVFAGVKFLISFAVVLGASWITAKLLLKVPGLKSIL